MEANKKNIWFPAMKYGVGWGVPITWQGWTVLLAYVLLMVFGSMFLTGSPGRFVFFPPYVIGLTVFLVFVCWKKGEAPELRRGDKKSTTDPL